MCADIIKLLVVRSSWKANWRHTKQSEAAKNLDQNKEK